VSIRDAALKGRSSTVARRFVVNVKRDDREQRLSGVMLVEGPAIRPTVRL